MARRRKRPSQGPVRITRPVYLRLPVALADEIRDLARTRGWFVNRWVEGVLERGLQKIRGTLPVSADAATSTSVSAPAPVVPPSEDVGEEEESWIPPDSTDGVPRTRTRF